MRSGRVNGLLVGAALIALALSSLVSSGPRVAWALQAVVANDVFATQHFMTLVGDNTVRTVNPTVMPIGTSPTDGLLCEMIYVYDAHEEQMECCGCPVTNNGLRTMGVIGSLTANPLGGPLPRVGLIKIVSAVPNLTCPVAVGPGQACPNPPPFYPCDPATAYTPTQTLRSWIEHSDQVFAGGGLAGGGQLVRAVQEVEFLDSPLDAPELTALQSNCAFIHRHGSGSGLCSCGEGDTLAARPGAGQR